MEEEKDDGFEGPQDTEPKIFGFSYKNIPGGMKLAYVLGVFGFITIVVIFGIKINFYLIFFI